MTIVLMSVAIVLSGNAFASESLKPSASEEAARLEELKNAKTPEQLMDAMTPAEIAEAMGIPSDENEYQQWLESQPELLYSPVGSLLVDIYVNIGNQSITVNSPEGSFTSKVSTGRPGYATKRGCHTVKWMSKMHYSKKYENAPMPHSIFYYGGFAIHATYEERRLGRPASHGCVRVSRATAKVIYRIVESYGQQNTRICVE